jgi:hypothetical protein
MVDVPDENAPFRKAIDSTLAITLARFFMPLVVAVLGYFLVTTLGDLKSRTEQVQAQVFKMIDVQSATNSMQSGLSVKVDSAVKQLDHLQAQVDGLQKR